LDAEGEALLSGAEAAKGRCFDSFQSADADSICLESWLLLPAEL
jgi:hypothetical protein